MAPPPKPDRPQQGDSGSHAYGSYGSGGYGQYGYGYGAYGGYGQGGAGPQRSLQDYLMILRERVWFVVLVFLIVVASVALYTFTRMPLYQASASVQIFRRDPVAAQVQGRTEAFQRR